MRSSVRSADVAVDGGGDDPARRSDRKSFPRIALGSLTLVFIVLGLLQAARDSPTVDEAPDLAAALVTIEERDLRITPEHGALYRAAAGALPVLLADPVVPRTAAYEDGAWFDYTADLISANEESGRLDDVLFWFRVIPLLAGAAAAWVLFGIGRRLGGDVGGVLAGGMWLTTPYVLGLSHLGSLDVVFSLAVSGLVLSLVRDHERPSIARLAEVAVVLGLSLVVRHSAVVLVPVALVFVVMNRRGDRRRVYRAVALSLLIPVLVVWLVHRSLDPVPVDGPPRERFDAMIATAASQGPIERVILAVPMPVDWQAGFAYLALTADPRPAYLFGETWEGSRPWFFPASAFVKLPISATVAILAGLVVIVQRRRSVTALGPLAATGAVLSAFLLLQPLNLGLRLALPVIALAMVPVAMLADFPKSRLRRAALGALVATQLASTFAAHPASLAWTPPPFSDGYRWVSDSSIDFGQGRQAVEREHRAEPFVAVSLVTPRGVDRLPGTVSVVDAEPSALVGRLAVGATPLLVTDAVALSWLRRYCPVEVLEGSVLVYDFDSPPDRTAASGMPAEPCGDGGPSR